MRRFLHVFCFLLLGTAAGLASGCRADVDPADASRGLSSSEIQGALAGALPDIEACHRRAAALDASLGGEISVSGRITTAGRLTDLRVERSDLGDRLDGCVLRVLGAVRFPEADAETELEQSFELEPTHAAATPPETDLGPATPPALAEHADGPHRSVRGLRARAEESTPAIEACYEAAVAARPELAGTLAVIWEVDEEGAVTSAEIRDEGLGCPALDACVLAEARSWRYEPKMGAPPAQATYSWRLHTEIYQPPAPEPTAPADPPSEDRVQPVFGFPSSLPEGEPGRSYSPGEAGPRPLFVSPDQAGVAED